MSIRLLRITLADLERHEVKHGDLDGIPLYYFYDEVSGQIRIWPPDRKNKYPITLTIEESFE